MRVLTDETDRRVRAEVRRTRAPRLNNKRGIVQRGGKERSVN